MGHFQKSRHGRIFQNLAMARFLKLRTGEISKISPWRDFQSFAMARFLKPGYGEIHSGIVSIFLDYATREGHLQGEKKIRKRKRKGKVMMAKTRPVKGWGPK